LPSSGSSLGRRLRLDFAHREAKCTNFLLRSSLFAWAAHGQWAPRQRLSHTAKCAPLQGASRGMLTSRSHTRTTPGGGGEVAAIPAGRSAKLVRSASSRQTPNPAPPGLHSSRQADTATSRVAGGAVSRAGCEQRGGGGEEACQPMPSVYPPSETVGRRLPGGETTGVAAARLNSPQGAELGHPNVSGGGDSCLRT
jgi:hypothetical protein